MSFASDHGWLPAGSVQESLTAALSNHLHQSHLTSLWMPKDLCSQFQLDKVARLFIRRIRSPGNTSTESGDDWSASVIGTEGPISVQSTLLSGELSVRMSYEREDGARSDLYVYYSPPLPFTV